MKKTIFALASLVLIASACSKDSTINTKNVTFTATINMVQDTKVQLDTLNSSTSGTQITYPIQFISGDQIAVINNEFDALGQQSPISPIAAFASTQTGKAVQFAIVDPSMDPAFYSSNNGYEFYYPYNDDKSCSVAQYQTMVAGNASIGGIALKAHSDATTLDDSQVVFSVESTLLRIKPTILVKVATITFVNGTDVVTLTCDSSNSYKEYIMGVNPGVLDIDALIYLQDRDGSNIGEIKMLNQDAQGNSLNRSLASGRMINVKVTTN